MSGEELASHIVEHYEPAGVMVTAREIIGSEEEDNEIWMTQPCDFWSCWFKEGLLDQHVRFGRLA